MKINKNDANNLYFTGDTHFNHQNICTYCKSTRPLSEKTMTKAILEQWRKLPKEAIIFHLGDLGFFTPNHPITEIMEGFPSKQLILIKGNHDKIKDIRHPKIKVVDYLRLDIKDPEIDNKHTQTIILFHYPLLTWGKKILWFLAFTWTYACNSKIRGNSFRCWG